jgi:hypothetical protein
MISSTPRALLPSFLICFVFSLASSAQSAVPEISLSGNISSHSIREDEVLQFTINIKNKVDSKTGPSSVRALTLWKLPDSYTLDDSRDICVVPFLPSRTNSCETPKAFFDSHNLLAESLAPGESLTVQGYLKPTGVHKTSTLTAVLAWSAVGNGKPSPAAYASQWVSLGESQVVDNTWLGRLSADEILKIVAVPALLLMVGGLTTLVVNLVNVWREKRTHAQEQLRSIRSETWKQMLPVSHTYAAKCYLPLSLAAGRLAASLHALGSPGGSERVTFFQVLLCGSAMTKTRKKTGGFYFKDLRGETLAAECWRLQREALIGANEEDPFNLAIRNAVDCLGDIETYGAFMKKFPEVAGAPQVTYINPDIQAAWSLFTTWAKNPAAVATVEKYLEGLVAVLDYESNRPYEYWYDTVPRLVVSEPTEDTLREVLVAKKYTEKEVKQYFEAVVRP